MKSKTIKIITIIATLILLAGLIAGVVRAIAPTSPPTQEPTGPSVPIEPTTAYLITYKSVTDGGAPEDVYAPLFYEDGNYPTSYEAGKGATVSPLKGEMTEAYWEIDGGDDFTCYIGSGYDEGDISYEFYGWYYDADCTQKMNGSISKMQTGNVTLYAKIAIAEWIGPY